MTVIEAGTCTAKTAVVDPTVVLDSVSLAPAASACVASSLAPLVVVTNPAVVAMFLVNRPIALTLAERKAVYLADLYELEDGSGHWLFEDDSAILLGQGAEGSQFHLWPRSLALTLGEEHG